MSHEVTQSSSPSVPGQPVAHVEAALQSLAELRSSGKPSQVRRALDQFWHALVLAAGIRPAEGVKPVDAVFVNDLSHSSRQIVAACLLRLIAANEAALRDGDVHLKALKFLDAEVGPKLYPRLELEPKAATHTKLATLSDVVPKAEQTLDMVLSEMRALDKCKAIRGEFMKKLNFGQVKFAVDPFLSRKLLEMRLPELCESAEAYALGSGPKVVQWYEKARRNAETLIAASEVSGSQYDRRFLGGFAHRVLDLLNVDFAASPYSKPANLRLVPLEKKYPLHVPGGDFSLSFTVHNDGPGQAFDVTLKIGDVTDVTIAKNQQFLGQLEPQDSVVVNMTAVLQAGTSSVIAEGDLSWSNHDKSERDQPFTAEFKAQRSDIDWETLVAEEPYSTEPIENEDELVGRGEILNQLTAKARAKNMSSAFVTGQKRVGKTSVVRTLKERLARMPGQRTSVIYLEGGNYTHPDAKRTIEMLGGRLCREIQRIDYRLKLLPVPQFDGALAPLDHFLNSALDVVPELRILVILDEFDELPVDLYKPGEVGNAFFLTLRAISGSGPFGFLLVGGEKMEYIVNSQGKHLNKFDDVRVDYFEKATQWSDFLELVRRPVSPWLEITDAAVAWLYSQTAGNPFFTKLICKEVFASAVRRRDCFVTEHEVHEAARTAMENANVNRFQHFWEDGIVEKGDKLEERSINRKKLLLALVQTLRKRGAAPRDEVLQRAIEAGLPQWFVDAELQDFVRRQIITETEVGYRCKVGFFEDWLKDKGVTQIMTTFTNADEALERKREEERLRVTAREVVHLAQQWGTYKGRAVGEEIIRAWLDQFDEGRDQRLMYQLLQGVRFYREAFIREKMRDAFSVVARAHGNLRLDMQSKRKSEILVSHLGDVGKSGVQYARMFAEENEIYINNVVEFGKIGEAIEANPKIQALSFIDDFIGTGNSAINQLKELDQQFGTLIQRREIAVIVVAVSGFDAGRNNVDEALRRARFPIRISVCDPLTDADRPFSVTSRVFRNAQDRQRALEIAHERGLTLERKTPLGYGDGQAVVAFAQSCPNNTLPILRVRSKDWIPLFER